MNELTPSKATTLQLPLQNKPTNELGGDLQVARLELCVQLELRILQLGGRRAHGKSHSSDDIDDTAWRIKRAAAIKELNRLRKEKCLSYRKAAEEMDAVDHWHVHFMARHRKGFDHVASFVTYAKRYNASH